MSMDYSAMAFPKASWMQEKRQKKPQKRKVAPVQRKKEALQEGAEHYAG